MSNTEKTAGNKENEGLKGEIPKADEGKNKSMKEKLKELLTSGATAEKLALSFACGVSCGNFPIPFLTTLPCLLATAALGLILPATLLVNYAVTPMNIATIVPLIRFGEWIMNEQPVQLDEMMTGFKQDAVATLQRFSYSVFLGILGWLIVWPFLTIICYYPFLFILKRVMMKTQGEGQSKQKHA